jgi:diaminohydroxyphosphoribosylaminopyrimidine deaminase/5-amino-6-(5-phosphoribosylamino)uracil reductase
MDAIIVSIGTAPADDPLLTARPPGPRVATRVVFDSQARLPIDSQLVRTAGDAPLLVVTHPQAPRARVAQLRGKGVEVFPCGPDDSQAGNARPDPAMFRAELGQRRMTNVLIEGGSELLGAFFDQRLIDEAHVFVAPEAGRRVRSNLRWPAPAVPPR